MKSIYLCGPIAGLSLADAAAYRQPAADALRCAGFSVRDPMRGVAARAAIGEDAPGLPTLYLSRDLRDIGQCDAVLADFRRDGGRVSIGSCVEIGVAATMSKPIVVMMEPDCLHDHPFIRGTAVAVCSSEDEAVNRLLYLLAD